MFCFFNYCVCCRVRQGMRCPADWGLLYLLYCLIPGLLHSFTLLTWPMTALEFVTLIPGSQNFCFLLHNEKPLLRLKLKLLLSCFIFYFNAPVFPRYNHVHILNYKAVLKLLSLLGLAIAIRLVEAQETRSSRSLGLVATWRPGWFQRSL